MTDTIPNGTRVRTTQKARGDREWWSKPGADEKLWGQLGTVTMYSEKRDCYMVHFEGSEAAGWFARDEFEILPQKLQPFWIELGPLDTIQKGDELKIDGTGYAGPHGGRDVGKEHPTWVGWKKSEAHSWGTTLERLMVWWSAVKGARRLIIPKLEE